MTVQTPTFLHSFTEPTMAREETQDLLEQMYLGNQKKKKKKKEKPDNTGAINSQLTVDEKSSWIRTWC